MKNYRFLLQYEGTRYQGWQRQESSENTIQGKLEMLLSRMCGHKVEVQGSGRTDAGVHALGQVANAHMCTEKTPWEIMEYMNQYLPEDIGVLSVKEVSERFHSRLNARGKTYCYRIINSPVPQVFQRRYAHTVVEKLDVEAMRQGAGFLVGKHDFAAFTSAKKGKKSTVRTVEEILIERQGNLILLTFSGDGFLYHMVRILTGTLLEVGLGRRKPEEIIEILNSGSRAAAGELVPAKGLTLVEVRY